MELMDHPALGGIDAALVEQILHEVIDRSPGVHWDAIAGLEFAKKSVHEITVLPLLHPHIFQGARKPPRGLLLFGPPGTGKTLIAKAIATEAQSTFFSISASSLMSKWMGEGEKMVKALVCVGEGEGEGNGNSEGESEKMVKALGCDGEGEFSSLLRSSLALHMKVIRSLCSPLSTSQSSQSGTLSSSSQDHAFGSPSCPVRRVAR